MHLFILSTDGGNKQTEPENFDKGVSPLSDTEVDIDEKAEDNETAKSHSSEEIVKNDKNIFLENPTNTENISNIAFKVVWNKQSFHVVFDENKKVEDLKDHIKDLTGKIYFIKCFIICYITIKESFSL